MPILQMVEKAAKDKKRCKCFEIEKGKVRVHQGKKKDNFLNKEAN